MNSPLLKRMVNFPNLLSAGFFVAVLVQVWNHIMWRDEIRTWQVCREATGLISLWNLMRWEGVPVLWYWIVFVLTRLSDNPFLMQFVHVLIATGVVYVVARWAPFSKLTKGLFAFGYYPFFEYAAITRNYSLLFLLIVIACAMISRERIRWWALAGVLFLLTQVSIWGAGLAGLLLLAAMARSWYGATELRPGMAILFGTSAIVLLGFVLCVIEVLPGPGASFTDSWKGFPTDHRIFLSLGTIYRAWVPIPLPGPHFWNSNILDWRVALPSGSKWQAGLAIVLMLVVILSIARRPVALIWFLVAVGALVGFTYLKFRGSARHDGILFVVLIASLWLSRLEPLWTITSAGLSRFLIRIEKRQELFLQCLVGLSAVIGIACAVAGLVMPFSATKSVADHIRKNFPPDIPIAVYTDYGASPISTWLGRPVYSIPMHRDAYYNTQDDKQRDPNSMVNGPYILDNLYQLIRERSVGSVLFLGNSGVSVTHTSPLVSYQPTPNSPPRYLHLTDIVEPGFQVGVVQDESHNVYLVRIP